jgi:hypothetical protein
MSAGKHNHVRPVRCIEAARVSFPPLRVSVRVEGAMKSLKWAAAFGAVAVGVILYLNKDDVVRYQKMRQM